MEDSGAAIEFEGELAKKGAGFMDRWQDRYFVLNDEGNLLWYKNIEEKKSGAEAQGQLAVNQIIRIEEQSDPGYFDLVTPGRAYHLHASSSGTYYDMWVEAINRAQETIRRNTAPSDHPAASFRKKYTVSEIDFEQSRKADRQLVFDEVDGVTNMRSMARWRYAPEKIQGITRAAQGSTNPFRFTLSVVQEYSFEARSEAQLAEIENAVAHLLRVAGNTTGASPSAPSNATLNVAASAAEHADEDDCDETVALETAGASAGGRGVCLEDFEIIRIIGKGGQGQVAQVKHITSKKMFAMKSCSVGDKLKSQEGLRRVIAEKEVLQRIQHPFLVHLHYAFHKGRKIFLCIDLCNGGELYLHLSRQPANRFHPVVAGFYIGEIVAAIAYLHANDIIYRDMKPENILVCDDGHLKLTDFGLAKMGITSMYGGDGGDVTQSLVGTPEYLAPEILSSRPYGKASDWWTVGILMYELMVGKTPFIANGINRTEMFRRIQAGNFDFPSSVELPNEAKDMIKKLVVADPTHRLGTQTSDDIKNHGFFSEFLKMKFSDLENKKVLPPWRPQNITINANVAPSVAPDAGSFASGTEALSSEEEARMARFTFIDADFDAH